MTDDLVKRLREQAKQIDNYYGQPVDSTLWKAADRIEQQEKDIETLKAAFRVNMLRANASHEEIDAVISAALGGNKDG
jgi:hypothetical protein